jgi:hypothetical protein
MKHVFGPPLMVTCNEVKDQDSQCIRNNKWISADETAYEMSVSRG